MDLRKIVTLRSSGPATAATMDAQVNERLSLFEAVRRLTQDEGPPSLIIEDAGNQLTEEEILQITKTQNYKDLVLAFDDRR